MHPLWFNADTSGDCLFKKLESQVPIQGIYILKKWSALKFFNTLKNKWLMCLILRDYLVFSTLQFILLYLFIQLIYELHL